MNPTNVATTIDFYKADHRRQYPEGTEYVLSNWTPRASRVDGVHEVVFFGLQYFLERYLGEEWDRGFFSQDVDEVCDRYAKRMNGALGPNSIGTDHIRALHELGYLPLEFRALPEGALVPLRVPMLTVENTLPDFFWLVNYFETILSNSLWLPCTSATTALRYRKLLDQYAEETGGDPEFANWQAHDFSFRGLPGLEAAQLSGAAHLTSFWGTDTIPALDLIDGYYDGSPDDTVIGGSVAATEHSVMCAGGQMGEKETFQHLIELYPGADPEGFEIFSAVSDTWDLWNVLTNILPDLKDEVTARNGKMVVRPDSGDPVKILVGDLDADGPARAGVVELLWDVFGGTVTDKGYKVLDSHVGVIYGDSITPERCEAICYGLKQKGFASTNVVFGVGSYTYQYVTRDTYGFAMKATWVQINGEGRAIFKKPVTDDGTKFSATGRLAVARNERGELAVIENATPEEEAASLLEPVWRDGQFLRTQTFQEIRDLIKAQG